MSESPLGTTIAICIIIAWFVAVVVETRRG